MSEWIILGVSILAVFGVPVLHWLFGRSEIRRAERELAHRKVYATLNPDDRAWLDRQLGLTK